MKFGRSLTYLALTLVIASSVSVYLAYRYIKRWGETPILLSSIEDIRVPRGVTLKQLSKIFAERQIVSNALLFEAWVRIFSDYRQFQAGRYLFQGEQSPGQIATIIIAGEIYQPVVYSLTVPEGFTLEQIGKRIIDDGLATEETFQKLSEDARLLDFLKIPSKTLEGYLYPATYNFTTPPDAREVLKTMVQTFWKELPVNYENDISEKGLSLHEAVTIASLIERETGRADERSAVSEVIWNRLKRGIPLAIDASIIYGIPQFDGNLKRKHLKDKTNLYNTRVHAGLPPTPICSPSKLSLEAVLTPTDKGYFYYVVEDIETRKHHFSKTLKEHNSYVRKLIRQGG